MLKNPGIEHCEIYGESFGDEGGSVSRHIELGWNAAFEWLESQRNMEHALAECFTYGAIGGLDDNVLRDIAEAHDVSPYFLSKEWYDNE